MDKVINVENLRIYREAVKALRGQGVSFDKERLINNPGLCREIVRLVGYFRDEELRVKNEE
jgi:hypothetical protein